MFLTILHPSKKLQTVEGNQHAIAVVVLTGSLSIHPNSLLAETQVTFKTKLKGLYVTAENAGGGAVTANRTAAQSWETFQLIDKNGGSLESGDLVFLKSSNGFYVQAPPQAQNHAINAASRNQLDWETFRLVKVSGSCHSAMT